MADFTPGPWVAVDEGDQEWAINAPNGDPTLAMSSWHRMAVVYGNEDEPRKGAVVGSANARLIAAAPDLLAALEALLAAVDQMDKPVSSGGGVLPVDKALATGAARAAIARTKKGEA